MPPSPAMRCSPGREPRGDNHKRGRSLESGMPLKHRDDDLALFNEVQNRERDNFLLQGNDDFEDIFANKLRHFSDYKLGINIPARGETSDLLHAEEEKNDYEWLITPPDTPLFTSLDDEAPPINLAQRGRTRTQPISISRSSTMEKNHRNSRGSASPNRASPNRASPNRVSLSPRSHNSTFESRGRAYSATSASPPTTFRPTTTATALRSSPPPSWKPLPRASTPPPPRRLSTGSNGTTTPTRGISGKTSRGNSASPKVKAWESSIPGFSTEVPPNLRTSLVDRPVSYVRGSSPASRNSRQSMSPTASRSISSSHSKGSVASSGEDDMESLSSVVVGRLNLRRGGGFQNKKVSPSKKPSRTVSSSSAPKRSFDLALRQMDHRKGPHNMFRPLLSSVPSSTFHVGIATSPHHTITSRNSSVTTSSNASSGLGTSGPHDHEASQDDATSGYAKIQDFDVNDDVFMIEKDETHDPFFDDSRKKTDLDPTSLIPDATYQKGLLICSRCGCGYSPIVENTNLCPDCIDSNSPLTFVDPSIAVSQSEPEEIVGVESLEVMGNVKPSGLSEVESLEGVDFLKSKVESLEGVDFLKPKAESSEGVDLLNSKAESLEGVDLLKPKDESLESVDLLKPKDESLEGVDFLKPKVESLQGVDFLKPKVESLEGVAGISLLLKRSNSIKGTVVRNTNFSASSISYDDLSYVRENNTSSMRSVSASSSVDFGHVKHANNTRFQRQSSSTKSESEHSNASFHPSNLGITTLDQENVNNSNLEPLKVEEDVSFQKDEDSGVDDSPAIDVAEASLEGELGHTFRSSPPSKCDMSSSSTSSIEELQENVTVSVEECHVSNHTSNIIGESVVLIEDEGLKGRSLTLEEATDTILFCSSIVQRLALNAATIAIEKETQSDENKSWPLIPATRKSELDKPEFQIRTPTKRSSKSQRSKHKKEVENDTNTPTTTTEKNVQPKTRIVGVREPNNGESKKPPLLESKCNCTIM